MSRINPIEVGKKIEIARKRKGLSQAKLAEMVGVSRASVSLYETGAGNPSYKILLRLSVALDIEVGDLTGLEEENHQKLPGTLYKLAYANGIRAGMIELNLGRKEQYREVNFFGEPTYLATLGIRMHKEDLPFEMNEPIEWPSVSVMEMTGVDYSYACIGIVEDNSMKPRYPKSSRHVLHPILDKVKWEYLTGVYGLTITGNDLIIRSILLNKGNEFVLADADKNGLRVQSKDVLMVWQIGQTIHMPPDN
jgi:putative transcriptional regulator